MRVEHVRCQPRHSTREHNIIKANCIHPQLSLNWTWTTFKPLQFSCEGFDSPQDTHILNGSCSLVYDLREWTESDTTTHVVGWFVVAMIILGAVLSYPYERFTVPFQGSGGYDSSPDVDDGGGDSGPDVDIE